VKKEKAAQQKNTVDKFLLNTKKRQMDERRDRALSTVKSAMNRNENLGMRHYKQNWQGIDWQRGQKMHHERAKSAYTYNNLLSRKEIEEAGGDYKTLLRLKRKIKLGTAGDDGSMAPYRNSMTLNSNTNRNMAATSIVEDDLDARSQAS
jgi:hypothetical protein